MKPCFAYNGPATEIPKPSENVVAIVNRLCLRFQNISHCVVLGVYKDKNYSIQFLWKGELFFQIAFVEGNKLCHFAGYSDLQKPMGQWCRASFKKFPFEDGLIPEALCALLEKKADPANPNDSVLYSKIVAMIKPGERIAIPIDC